MPDEKPYKYENLPIPSYEEATSSRAPTPVDRPNEQSNEEERQGLMRNLGGHQPTPTRRANYRPPWVSDDDSRDSLDGVDFLDGEDGRDSTNYEDEEVRREVQEMEVIDPPTEQSRWTKRISSISQSLSWIHLPFRLKMPNWKFKWPKLDSNLFILMGRFFAIFLVMATVYLLFMSGLFTSATSRMVGQMYDPEDVRIYVQSQVNPENIRLNLQLVTSYDHLAGTEGDYVLSKRVQEIFAAAGLEDVRTEEYGVYLNYPKDHGRMVGLLREDGSIKFGAKIEEEQVYKDPPRQQTPVFHGHSRTGDVSAPLIFANYGSREDFKRLYDSGIDTKGAMALVRQYGGQEDPALKVKAAEQAGFVGCIIYSDPADDGFVKGDVWPNGRFMPSDGVQRGSVSLRSLVLGDVLTPGWASKPGAERLSKDKNPGLNNIPSIPISWRDAQPLLQAIKGYGTQCPPEWQGGVPDIGEWWSGNLSSPKVRLQNEQDEVEQQPIWNVMGRIRGVEQTEKSIIVGNHRDSWSFGATDPGSGTAVFLEVIRIFGELKRKGWRPLRTIEFASWDGEEFNLIGSTEFVEDNVDTLRMNGFAYINVDVGVSGQEFHAAASPVFKKSLLRVLDRTSDPTLNVTLRQLWDDRHEKLEGLSADSDYVAFQDIAGVSSIDLGFRGSPYPYHSVYETLEWMEKFGDPGFQYHQLLGQVWALLILEMASRPVLPFDMSGYSSAITFFLLDLEKWSESKGPNQEGKPKFSLEPLREAVLQFNANARQFEQWEADWETVVYGSGGFESTVTEAHRMSHNTRMANFETHLLDLEEGGGLPGREQFKHILFAPEAWSSNTPAFFPGIRDAIEAGNWELAQKSVEKAAGILKRASHKLVGNS